jgi:hypothetical protein
VFGDEERATFEHENAMAMSLIVIEQVLRQSAAEAAAADDDSVEWTGIRACALVRTLESFIQPVADKATHHVA